MEEGYHESSRVAYTCRRPGGVARTTPATGFARCSCPRSIRAPRLLQDGGENVVGCGPFPRSARSSRPTMRRCNLDLYRDADPEDAFDHFKEQRERNVEYL